MNDKKKPVEPIPEEFATYEEAAEFWDSHDTTDYPEAFETIELKAELRQRHYEIEIDEDIIKALRKRAQKHGMPVRRLVSEMLRQQMTLAA